MVHVCEALHLQARVPGWYDWLRCFTSGSVLGAFEVQWHWSSRYREQPGWKPMLFQEWVAGYWEPLVPGKIVAGRKPRVIEPQAACTMEPT